jgi:hypothetical protein
MSVQLEERVALLEAEVERLKHFNSVLMSIDFDVVGFDLVNSA